MRTNHETNANGDNFFTRMFVTEDYASITWQKVLTTYSQHKYMLMAMQQMATFKAKESSRINKKEIIYNTVAPQPFSNKFENDEYWAPSSVCGIHPDCKKKHANGSCHLQT